jgi:hypothetical protein
MAVNSNIRVPRAYGNQLHSPVYENMTGTIKAAVMVGDMTATDCANNSTGPRQCFLRDVIDIS